MKNSLSIVFTILIFSSSCYSQNWQGHKLKAIYANQTQTDYYCYIDVETNSGNTNVEINRPRYSGKGAQFLGIYIEKDGFSYEISPSTSKKKRLKLEPGRYKVTLKVKLWGYYDGHSKVGSYGANVRWFGYKD